MTRLYLLSALLPIIANVLAIGATNETASAARNETSVVDGAFIVECSSLSDVESLRQEIQSLGGTIRQNYTSDIFLAQRRLVPASSCLISQYYEDVMVIAAMPVGFPGTRASKEDCECAVICQFLGQKYCFASPPPITFRQGRSCSPSHSLYIDSVSAEMGHNEFSRVGNGLLWDTLWLVVTRAKFQRTWDARPLISQYYEDIIVVYRWLFT
ncbi:hypothetical protein HC256_008776 [Beauveria bassiana]|nr:hypothetical protein HC256_008776 [Beauveria bassiana]